VSSSYQSTAATVCKLLNNHGNQGLGSRKCTRENDRNACPTYKNKTKTKREMHLQLRVESLKCGLVVCGSNERDAASVDGRGPRVLYLVEIGNLYVIPLNAIAGFRCYSGNRAFRLQLSLSVDLSSIQ
jgi:hypothetical protein